MWLTKLGPKFVPFPHPLRFACSFAKAPVPKFHELRRVLVWDAYFHRFEGLEDLFPQLPYKKLFPALGTNPPRSVEDKLGPAVAAIDREIERAKDHCLLSLHDFVETGVTQFGVPFRKSALDSYLDETLMVQADKDSSWVLVSLSAYLSEAQAHMVSKSRTGVDNYIFLGSYTNVRAHWLSAALRWRDLLGVMVVTHAPEPLSHVLSNFSVASPAVRFPTFRLLAKTYKKMHFDGIGFPSRLVVGLSS